MDKKLQEKIDKGMLRLKEISEELIEMGVPCALLVPNPYNESRILMYTQMEKHHLKRLLGSALIQLDESYASNIPLSDVDLGKMKG